MSVVRKQVDSDYEGDHMVAFVYSEPIYSKGDGFGDYCTSETYYVDICRKPLDTSGVGFAGCHHRHRSIDAAVRCARAKMRAIRRARKEKASS